MTEAKKPRFRWVASDAGTYYELREVGEHHSFATVCRSSRYWIDGPAMKHGFEWKVSISGGGLVAYCRNLDTAKDVARELAAEDMATKNSVAWEAGRHARWVARQVEEEARAAAARTAAELERRKEAVMREALDQYVANTEAALEDAEEEGGAATLENLRRQGIDRASLNLARQMLEELSRRVAAMADRSMEAAP